MTKDTNLLKKEFEEKFKGEACWASDEVWAWFESKLIGEKQDDIKVVWNETCEKIREDSLKDYTRWIDHNMLMLRPNHHLQEYLKSKENK